MFQYTHKPAFLIATGGLLPKPRLKRARFWMAESPSSADLLGKINQDHFRDCNQHSNGVEQRTLRREKRQLPTELPVIPGILNAIPVVGGPLADVANFGWDIGRPVLLNPFGYFGSPVQYLCVTIKAGSSAQN